jgi:hypothetical protein
MIRRTVAKPMPVPGNSSSRWSCWKHPKEFMRALHVETNAIIAHKEYPVRFLRAATDFDARFFAGP